MISVSKQNKTKTKTKQTKNGFSRGGHIPLRHPLCASANHSLISKPGPRPCMPIKKPIHNEWAFIISPNIILYRTTSNDFAEKLVLKMKEKLCEERRFGVLKTLKTQELPGALPPGPPPGRCPWAPPGALERAPGPHAFKTLRSLRSLHSTWTQTIFIQHPAVTNLAHAHDTKIRSQNKYQAKDPELIGKFTKNHCISCDCSSDALKYVTLPQSRLNAFLHLILYSGSPKYIMQQTSEACSSVHITWYERQRFIRLPPLQKFTHAKRKMAIAGSFWTYLILQYCSINYCCVKLLLTNAVISKWNDFLKGKLQTFYKNQILKMKVTAPSLA